MVVRLRLAMHGKRNDRIFHIVAISNPKRRNAKPIDTLGVFNPHTAEGNSKTVEWNVSRIKRWLENGAQPTERVAKLLQMGQLLPPDSKWLPSNKISSSIQTLQSVKPSKIAHRRPERTTRPAQSPPNPGTDPFAQDQDMARILRRLELGGPSRP